MHAVARQGWVVVATLLVVALAPRPAFAALISQEEEIRIGREAAAQIEAKVGLTQDPALETRLQGIGRRIAAVSSRRDLPYTFKVLRGREANAISLPGGFIYATEGLMRFVRSDAELAFVMGHEIGHVAARHHVAMIEQHLLLGLLGRLLLGGEGTAALAGDVVRFLLTRGFSRENEFQADRLGVGFAHRAGYDASAALTFMARLRASEGRDPDSVEVLLRTHPALVDRIQRMRPELRALGYRLSG
jgi:predicted Zn-dependent protease